MRIRNTGEVEFSQTADDNARYSVESTSAGTIYLMPIGHRTKTNVAGHPGWYLVLGSNGRVQGNGAKTQLAQWRLVAAGDVPAYTPTQVQQVNGGDITRTQRGNSASSTHLSGGSSRTVVGVQERNQQMTQHSSDNPTLQDSIDQQLKWLNTRVGQMFLKREPVLMRMYEAGTIRKVLHRPDWHTVALNWKDYSVEPIPYSVPDANALTAANLQWYFDQGYVTCEQIIPRPLVSAALKIINFWLGQYPLPQVDLVGNVELRGEITTDQSVLSLFYDSPLVHIAQKLLGEGNISPCLEASISLRYPQLGDSLPSSGPIKNSELGGKRWFIDGPVNCSEINAYSILFAVPLSATEDSFEGNLCVFPEGHAKTFEMLRELHRNHGDEKFTGIENFNIHDELDMAKPDIGEPKQLFMKPGDVTMVAGMHTPRRDAPNYSPNIRYMVYFRVFGSTQQQRESAMWKRQMWEEYYPALSPTSMHEKKSA